MKVGVLVEAEEGLDWDRWRRTVAAAERLGFESVWISDHLSSSWTAGREGLEAWTALAAAASWTERIALGTLVSPVTFREPAIVARMAATLFDLTRNRFVVGLGLGWNADEHHAAGIAFPPVSKRAERLITTIECVKRESSVPILVGGKGPRSTLPIVAHYADEWNVTPSSAEEYRRSVDVLARLCGEVGRDPSEILRSVAVGLLIGREAELCRRGERMRSIVKPLAEVDDVLDSARRMGWVAGTPEEVTSVLRAFGEAGVDRVVFGHYDVEDVDALELVAREVLPAVA